MTHNAKSVNMREYKLWFNPPKAVHLGHEDRNSSKRRTPRNVVWRYEHLRFVAAMDASVTLDLGLISKMGM